MRIEFVKIFPNNLATETYGYFLLTATRMTVHIKHPESTVYTKILLIMLLYLLVISRNLFNANPYIFLELVMQ